MKQILKYIHTILMVAAVGYLRYTIFMLPTISQASIFIASGITLFMLLLIWIKYSHVGKKKWWIFGLSLVGIIVSELVLRNAVDLTYVNDMVKLWLVITTFMALFGVFGGKKEFVKGEYGKKAQIIEI